ncbi:hypothetical protein P3T76_003445 [Phytophthora citrophthora]|uniref:Uncharacterized protein n=1 Tax=Phytophthora citrophthora TaxID=4793 RepID=A0AAD9GUB2_9STRA|nr:hypothetical protein P3T76_003445 [Phytophthora citrophthora]
MRTNGQPAPSNQSGRRGEGPVTEKMFKKLSELAEKAGKNGLSKKLEHKSWLAGGKGPQGKTKEELMDDPSFLRYFGFDEKWIKAQQKKKILYTVDEWVDLWNEQMKRQPPKYSNACDFPQAKMQLCASSDAPVDSLLKLQYNKFKFKFKCTSSGYIENLPYEEVLAQTFESDTQLNRVQNLVLPVHVALCLCV